MFDGDDKLFLSTPLKQQILAYITRIANSYHSVGFLNFSHASHVLLSATKLVTIIKSQHYDTSRDLTDTIYDPTETFTEIEELKLRLKLVLNVGNLSRS